MPLDTYRAKRNFSKTPEPSGDETGRPARGARFFCVQKHLASHLHYDFRLEHEGVLLSWAVPKGPALDPSIKRFATQVEDHPLGYGEFEGVIPEGYGAGIVMLWDKGTWEPEAPDIDAALKKGDLKFRLEGFKLKGSWVLVRTGRGPGGERSSWLLIKHRDGWAGPLDVTEEFPQSVKSGGDFADILAQDNPEIWRSNRPARGGQAGELFEKIVARALAMRGQTPAAKKAQDEAESGHARRARRPSARKTTGGGARTARKAAAAPRPGQAKTRAGAAGGSAGRKRPTRKGRR